MNANPTTLPANVRPLDVIRSYSLSQPERYLTFAEHVAYAPQHVSYRADGSPFLCGDRYPAEPEPRYPHWIATGFGCTEPVAWDHAACPKHSVACSEALDQPIADLAGPARRATSGTAQPMSPEAKALIAEATRYLAECEARHAGRDDFSTSRDIPDFILSLLADPKRGTKWFRITENMAAAIIRTRDAEKAAVAKAAEQTASQPRLPEVIRWMGNEAPRNDFAASLIRGIARYGSLTQNQYAAALRIIDRPVAEQREVFAAPKAEAAEGWYKVGETVYKVQKAVHGSGHLYAKRLVVTGPGEASWEYEAGAVRRLSEADRLTPEAAAAFGRLYGVCGVCGKTLTDETSIEAGIGPVCIRRITA